MKLEEIATIGLLLVFIVVLPMVVPAGLPTPPSSASDGLPPPGSDNSTVLYMDVTLPTDLHVYSWDGKWDLDPPRTAWDYAEFNLSELYSVNVVAFDVLSVSFDWYTDDTGMILDNTAWARISIWGTVVFERQIHAIKGTNHYEITQFQRHEENTINIEVETKAIAGALGGDATSEISNVVLTLRIYYISG